MLKNKIIVFLIYTLTGFTIAHGLLVFVIANNRTLYANITFHYSDSFIWYLFFFGIPFLAGLAFYLFLKNKKILKGVKILFSVIVLLQLGFTITATCLNSRYWGYAFKRPVIFKEVAKAKRVLNSSYVTNCDSARIRPLYCIPASVDLLENLDGREDPYYGNLDRPFMVFQDHSHIHGYLYYFSDIFHDENYNISDTVLHIIDKQIQATQIIDKSDTEWYDQLGEIRGIVTEFMTSDSILYIFASFQGREVANDHYPFYEFLFINKNGNYTLTKIQKYYTDVAGIEGREYANIAPVFSLLLTVLGIIAMTVILLIKIITLQIAQPNKKNRQEVI